MRPCIRTFALGLLTVLALATTPVLAQNSPPASFPSPPGLTAPPLPAAEASPKAAPGLEEALAPVVPVAQAGAPAPAEPPLTRPTLVEGSRISGGDTAWMLTSTALVMLMTIPGLALFYTGMVRKKNALGTMAHSFMATCLVTLLWVVIGYSLAFTPGNAYLGGLERLMLHGLEYIKDSGKLSVHHIMPSVPESVFVMFQLSFAIITPALITGAFAERMKFSALLWFLGLWSLAVYAPVAHWVWEPGGWLAQMGVLDFAGGTVVHINAGVSGLIAALMLGRRQGFGRVPMPPHNLVLTAVGACLLWVGWFGFNAGSAGAADGRAGMAMLVTQVGAALGALSWMCAEWVSRGKPSVLGMVSGAVSGLVAITPASGFVGLSGALAIGAVAGACCFWAATTLKSMLKYDDTLDVFGVHAVGGIVGALLTGVFAQKGIGGAEGSLAIQALGVAVTLAYSGVMTWAILALVQMTVGLRIAPEAEVEGLDIDQHGEHVI